MISFYSLDDFRWSVVQVTVPPMNGSIDEVILKLENDAALLIEWYKNNYLKPNPDKWHLILSEIGDDHFVHIRYDIDTKNIFNCENEKILGVYFDNKLNFKFHINKLCKKANQKLHAFSSSI